MSIQVIEGGVTAPAGFEAAGTAASIKYENRKDMALIYSKTPCTAAGAFTRNVIKAAPVIWDKKVAEDSPYVHAVVVNAGIANACTGKDGMDHCEQTAKEAGKVLGIQPDQVFVASTGVIGMKLPIDKISRGIHDLSEKKSASREAGRMAAEAIMTTDTCSKEAAVSFQLEGKRVTVGGMCKGSGMIHPNMCTMLAFVTTDLAISKELLSKAVKEDVPDTFNMVSVDGDTSTNDTLLVLANGMAGNELIESENQEGYELFKKALHYVNGELAKMMAGDGEGATALFEVQVNGTKTKEDARILSKSVICSSLTKAAIFGHDANWGRILCALGYAGVSFDPDRVDVFFQEGEKDSGRILICKGGEAADYSEEEATEILSKPHVRVVVNMNMGEESAAAWGCDLSYDYVKINGDYRS